MFAARNLWLEMVNNLEASLRHQTLMTMQSPSPNPAHYVGLGARQSHYGEVGDTPNIWARTRPFHDIKVWGGRFNDLKKKKLMLNIHILVTELQVNNHHQKIMSYNVMASC
jgi:hypothetical protein